MDLDEIHDECEEEELAASASPEEDLDDLLVEDRTARLILKRHQRNQQKRKSLEHCYDVLSDASNTFQSDEDVADDNATHTTSSMTELDDDDDWSCCSC